MGEAAQRHTLAPRPAPDDRRWKYALVVGAAVHHCNHHYLWPAARPDELEINIVICRNSIHSIAPFTRVYPDATIQNCEIERSIVLEHNTLADIGTRIQDSIVGRQAVVRRNDDKPKSLKMHIGDHSNLWVV